MQEEQLKQEHSYFILICIISIVGVMAISLFLSIIFNNEMMLFEKGVYDFVFPPYFFFTMLAIIVVLIFMVLRYQIIAGIPDIIITNKGVFTTMPEHISSVRFELPYGKEKDDKQNIKKITIGDVFIMFTGGRKWFDFPISGKIQDPIIVSLGKHMERKRDGYNVRSALKYHRSVKEVDPYIRSAIISFVKLQHRRHPFTKINFDENVTPVLISYLSEFDGSDTEENLQWETTKVSYNKHISSFEEREDSLLKELGKKMALEKPTYGIIPVKNGENEQ